LPGGTARGNRGDFYAGVQKQKSEQFGTCVARSSDDCDR
jgi:hypothetical protein